MAGCKSCYHKNENEVYYPQRVLSRHECKTCLYNTRYYECGKYPSFLEKMIEFESEKGTCFNNETFRVTRKRKFNEKNEKWELHRKIDVGECDELNVECGIMKSQDMNKQNLIKTIDQL